MQELDPFLDRRPRLGMDVGPGQRGLEDPEDLAGIGVTDEQEVGAQREHQHPAEFLGALLGGDVGGVGADQVEVAARPEVRVRPGRGRARGG